MKRSPVLAVVGLALISSGAAIGQEIRIETTTTTAAPQPTFRRVSQILGSTVQLQDGSGYGKVEDIVLDDDGRIDYLVVSRENQYAMMPYEAGRFDYGKRIVTYDVTPQAVQPLLFAPTAWPSATDPQFSERVVRTFGARGTRRAVRTLNAPDLEDADKVKIKEKDGKVKIKVKDRD